VDDVANTGTDAGESLRTQRHRIGILSHMDQVSDPSLRFLVLTMNTIQSSFEFEFIPFDQNDPFLTALRPGSLVDPEEVGSKCEAFRARQDELFREYNKGYNTKEPPPSYFDLKK
jgi:hypothetical protein